MFINNFKLLPKLLAIFLSLIIIPLFILGFFGYSLAKNLIISDIWSSLEAQIKTQKNMIENDYQKLDTDIETARQNAYTIVNQQAKILYQLIIENQANLEKLKNTIAGFTVGKTGYIYILDYNGRYIVSKNRQTDGKNIYDSRDSSGRLFIRDIIKKGRKLKKDEIDYDTYPWLNPGEVVAREKIAAILHIPSQGWVIGISAYFDDLVDMNQDKKLFTQIEKKLLTEKVGKTGYIYVMDSKGNLLIHPNDKGGNVFENDFIQQIITRKEGKVEYLWEGKEKIAAFNYVEEKDWYIVSGSYLSDFTGPLDLLRNTMFIIIALSIIIASSIAILFALSITRPLQKCVRFANLMGQGDFSGKIPIFQKDEIGQLIQALNMMKGKVANLISEVQSGAKEIYTGAGHVSTASQELAQQATRLAAMVETFYQNMQSLEKSVNQNFDNAAQGKSISSHVAEEVQEGGNAVNETIDSMKKIVNTISIISEIANNTNMLALNAAIEAARVGEQGEGFAVVAGEVRKLAERTLKAADETATLSQDSEQIANQTGEKISQVIPRVLEFSDLIANITRSSEKQKEGIIQLTTTADDQNQMSQLLSSQSEELAASAEEMASQSMNLVELVNTFKIADDSRLIEDNSQVLIKAGHSIEN